MWYAMLIGGLVCTCGLLWRAWVTISDQAADLASERQHAAFLARLLKRRQKDLIRTWPRWSGQDR